MERHPLPRTRKPGPDTTWAPCASWTPGRADFGTGHSNLACLQTLPASELKIDRTFIKDLPTSDRDRKLVHAMTGMAHDLGYRVVLDARRQPA